MSCKTTRVSKHGKDHLDAYRRKAWVDKYACRDSHRRSLEEWYDELPDEPQLRQQYLNEFDRVWKRTFSPKRGLLDKLYDGISRALFDNDPYSR